LGFEVTRILVGDVNIIAVESYVDQFLPAKGQLGVGYFIIHVAGRVFGVKDRRASVLGNSYYEVCERIGRRGKHDLSFSGQVDAKELSLSVLNILYDRGFKKFPLSTELETEMERVLYTSNIIWAPDGDEAFDDGSHVLQIDEGRHARVIALVNHETEDLTIDSIVELRISADEFYEILYSWSRKFEEEWRANFDIG
jgi:hypothetical protein